VIVNGEKKSAGGNKKAKYNTKKGQNKLVSQPELT